MYDQSNLLLDESKYAEDDEDKKKVVAAIFSYVRTSVRNSIESIRSWGLRSNYLDIIRGNSEILMDEFRISTSTEERLAVAQHAHWLRNEALDEIRAKFTPISQAFSKMIKEEGLKWEALFDKYFVEADGNLELSYMKIITASGES